MKTFTILTLSAAMIVLGNTSIAAQNLSVNAAQTLETFDEGEMNALKGTKLPFEKRVRNSTTSDGIGVSETQDVSEGTSRAKLPTIDPSMTWSDWVDLGTGTYTHGSEYFVFPGSEYTFKTNLQIHRSTVVGQTNYYQIKVENAFGDKDLIFWWEKDNSISTNDLVAENISADFTIDGYPYEFKSILISNATYTMSTGEIKFRVFYSVNDVDGEASGMMFNESVVLDGMPEYTAEVKPEKPVYGKDETMATINVACSNNIKSIRYYVLPEIDDTYSGVPRTLTEYEFSLLDKETVQVASGQIKVPISGYQNNIVYLQMLNIEGTPVLFTSVPVFSTQPDGLQWESIGYGKISDFDVQDLYVEDPEEALEWDVMLQQCQSDRSFYRLVNPYTNENSPFRNMQLIEDYSYIYDSAIDLTQDYYTYFRVQDNNLNKGNIVTSYNYPSGLYIQHKSTGALTSLYAQKFTGVGEDRKVSSAYSSFTFPEFKDYSFTLKDEGNDVITVVPVSPDTQLKYQILDVHKAVVVELRDVPSSKTIDLKNEGLDKSSEYLLEVYSYNLDGEERDKVVHHFNLGMTSWEFVGSGIYTYTTYYEMTCQHDLYRRQGKLDANHVQFKVDGWLYDAETNFIIDVADITQRDSDGHIVVTVPEVDTNFAHVTYGEVMASDVYTYSGYDRYLNSSYYIPELGEFQLYNVYYVTAGYFNNSYETFKLDGYPDLVLMDEGQTMTDTGYYQTFNVELTDVLYAKYGIYDAQAYTKETAISTLIADAGASRITESSSLMFDDFGDYIFAIVAYNADNEVVKTETGAFYNIPLIDMTKWQYLGEASFVDGWLLPGYTTENNVDYGWIVDAYVSVDDPNLIGLLSPYTSSRCALRNFNVNNVVENMIAIDLNDKNFIMMREQYSGFKSDTYGNFRIGNYEGGFMDYYGDKQSAIDAVDTYELPRTSMTADGIIIFPLCVIGCTGSDFGGVVWANPQAGFIYLPNGYSGVHDEIAIDSDDNAPVEYFNLQGVKIANPEHGIYIRRQGTKTTKVIRN